ncbi:Arf family guanine nucleotide exchange factor [Saccharomycopsis crataegensis]|uniref:Arf family guanine nucleotide exchange factor n=1 Tax=Saccharomycopsis crataegensis TaxID=43959 RepID=A0AAV5QQI6_9ASCO|nr:Arf family guanine nucleotide exchange factor [Saccharomycopsis crataegensis]
MSPESSRDTMVKEESMSFDSSQGITHGNVPDPSPESETVDTNPEDPEVPTSDPAEITNEQTEEPVEEIEKPVEESKVLAKDPEVQQSTTPRTSTTSEDLEDPSANQAISQHPEKTTADSSSAVTINVLKKLIETINLKPYKLNADQKEIAKDCQSILDQGKIPSIKLIRLLETSENNLQLKVALVDAVSKIFIFENSSSSFNQINYKNCTKFSDLCIDTIAKIFKDETDDAIELQIVKTVVNIILNDNVEVHTAKLLEGIRLIYNIFILTVNENTKLIAEATLTQIIDHYFQMIENGISASSSTATLNNSAKLNSSSTTSLNNNVSPSNIVLENLENLNEADEKKFGDIENRVLSETTDESDKHSLLVKDCFLIFRAMSKLSVKSIDENFLDARSTAVRSKLLSLKIIYSILKNHINCFLNKTITISSNISNEKIPFIDSIRNYLLLALTKNAVYQLNEIYSVCLDIFYIMITNLRAEFINEIPVLFSEIFISIVEMSVSSDFQKNYFLSVVAKLANDPRLLIEFYLNFDCSENQPNIIESLINFLIKTENNNLRNYGLTKRNDQMASGEVNNGKQDATGYDPTALNCIVSILRSLYSWTNKGLTVTNDDGKSFNGVHKRSSSVISSSREPSSPTTSVMSSTPILREISTTEVDNPTEFESAKKRKTLLLEYCKSFNYKPKKGIQKLIESNFIKSSDPRDVAKFLLTNNNILDKEVMGEYLGEGDEYNINVMHAFVDEFSFEGLKFVDAMRLFLQSFRLPGESQKIDRFMLKFAETYYKSHPNSVFAQADTLYVLSYSVIMLNTDQHNNQVKSRMTIEDFIKNNSGIDDGKDLPRQLLIDIYNDIANNEIILESEQHHALISGSKTPQIPSSTGLPNLFSSGKDINMEYYIQAAKEISSKTEKVIKSNTQGTLQKRTKFFSANHVEHVKSIFDTLWMSFLAALTPSFKEFDNKTISTLCLEGIKLSIKIACIFNLADARTSFINALLQFTNLTNIEEIKRKNLDAINVLLNICVSDGNHLNSSWTDVLMCISQLERLQLIAQGVDASNIPDVLNAKVEKTLNNDGRTSHESIRSFNTKFFSRRLANPSELAQQHHANQKLHPEIASLIASTELTVKIDKIFASTEKLDIDAITFFIEALIEVALDEVESSGNSSHPRIFSLQKMVDICYYNMGRIRVEWSRLWSIMGESFNKIGCNFNMNIVIFALDSLRQLSMRFFEIEELAYFKFQKDFLKPFAFVLSHNEAVECKMMVLDCIDNMILAKSDKIKSGWVTIFESFSKAAASNNDQVITRTYKMLSKINKNYFEALYRQDAFTGLVDAYTALACNEYNQRVSLHVISDMRNLIKKVQNYDGSEHPEVNKEGVSKTTTNTKTIKFLPVLTGFNKVILQNSDLESRSISLDHLFDSLVEYGENFDESSWSEICHELLFPIFGVLSNHWSQLNSHDDLSVWLSTTLIQALKNMVAIFTHFDTLLPMLDGYLKLLCSCILQENDTISRIGRNCLQSLILENCKKFRTTDWNKVTDTLNELFDATTAVELFLADPLRVEEKSHAHIEGEFSKASEFNAETLANGFAVNKNDEDKHVSDKQDDEEDQEEYNQSTDTVIIHNNAATLSTTQTPVTTTDGLDMTSPQSNNYEFRPAKSSSEEHKKRVKEKSIIVVKCVLQLLMIETLSEVFEDETFYEMIPMENLLSLIGALEKSYNFSHEFNEDYNLRVRLWNSGVIERLPNLLKQESSSSGVYINIVFRLLVNGKKATEKQREALLAKLIPLCVKIIEDYISLDETTKQRNINTWRPVVVEIMQGYYELEEDDFIKHCPIMYDLILSILDKQLPQELRSSIKSFLTRVGEVYVRI